MTPFWRIHTGLSREGPGDRASLDWALGHAAPPATARILDAGAGPGGDIAGLLAHAPQGSVLALETHAPYVAEIARRFGGDARVRAAVGDMLHPEGAFDLIWCAGAIYFAGVGQSLTCWRAHLKPGARVAFSQIAWKTAAPSQDSRGFWAAEYPEMCDRAWVLAQVDAAGFRPRAARFLPDSGWLAYYTGLEARMAMLHAQGPDSALAAALAQEQAEIDLWQAHGADFGYLQVVCEAA